MEKSKLVHRATLCLYAIAAIQAVAALAVIHAAASVGTDLNFGLGSPLLSGAVFWAAGLIVAAVIAARELKKGNPIAWVGALALFLLVSLSWCLPASVLGILSLIDVRVRTDFMEKLDVRI